MFLIRPYVCPDFVPTTEGIIDVRRVVNTDRKIFIGRISKQTTESDLLPLFERFGKIEECTITRDRDQISKGPVLFMN